jgi:hypothetical protein
VVGCVRLDAAMTHTFSIEFCANVAACRTEAKILGPSTPSNDALVALVYETSQGFVVTYFGSAVANPALPGLDAAIAEARTELLHYINRRGDQRPEGITRAGLSLWLTERDDETVIGIPLE